MSFVPIHLHTCWSLLDSSVLISDLVRFCQEKNIPGVCLTDHHNLKCVVRFHKELSKAKIKPIIGCEINIKINDTEYSRVTLLAKNYSGYQNLVKLVSLGNHKENLLQADNFTYGELPSVSWDIIREYSGNLICLLGDLNSDLCKSVFSRHDLAYRSNSVDMCKEYIDVFWKDNMRGVMEKYKNVFSDFFTFFDKSRLPILSVFEDCLKEVVGDTCLPSRNIHYINPRDSNMHQMLLTTASDLKRNTGPVEFFSDNRIFFTDSPECHLDCDLENRDRCNVILDLCEEYSIEQRPILPKFRLNDHIIKDPNEHLRDNCRSGFRKLNIKDLLSDQSDILEKYYSRIKHELEVFESAGISSYFLIVQDLIRFSHASGVPADVRGSSTGCMISYLLGISSMDPMNPDCTIEYSPERELPFERFYNEGRNTLGNISLADIDIDIPPNFRDHLISYIKNKYGSECVGHIITHSKFKAKGAIKEVFRLTKPVPNYFEVANDITKEMVDESKISDELVERQQDDPDYGIINWNIENVPAIANYYSSYKEAFDLALRMEQLPKNESVHAAGIIVADQPLRNLFPLRYSAKLDDLVIDIEGSDIEYLGGVKFDILGVAALEKLHQISRMVNEGKKEAPFELEFINAE